MNEGVSKLGIAKHIKNYSAFINFSRDVHICECALFVFRPPKHQRSCGRSIIRYSTAHCVAKAVAVKRCENQVNAIWKYPNKCLHGEVSEKTAHSIRRLSLLGHIIFRGSIPGDCSDDAIYLTTSPRLKAVERLVFVSPAR